MKYCLFIAVLLLSYVLNFSWSSEKINVVIHNQEELDKSISAASGIEKWKNQYYIISDDSMYITVIDEKFCVLKKIYLNKDANHENFSPMTKSQKKDLEAIAIGTFNDRELLIMLGSGSTDNRYTGYIYDLQNDTIKSVSLHRLYQFLKEVVDLTKDSVINIEGLAVSVDKVFIANRGNAFRDIIFVLEKNDFCQLLTADKDLSVPMHIQVIYPLMPKLGNYQSNLSGLDYDFNKDALFFSSSIELTEDAYNDGLILGSFIGKIMLTDLKENIDLVEYSQPLFNKNGLIQAKIESVIVANETNRGTIAFLVSDNDGLGSSIYQVEIY